MRGKRATKNIPEDDRDLESENMDEEDILQMDANQIGDQD